MSFTSEDTFHMCENSFCPSILWLRMKAGGAIACKNICTFAQLRTFDEYQFPNSIKMEPNLDFSSILHFSAAIYHHFQFEETMFSQKKSFSLRSKSIGFRMLSWWHTKFSRRIFLFFNLEFSTTKNLDFLQRDKNIHNETFKDCKSTLRFKVVKLSK